MPNIWIIHRHPTTTPWILVTFPSLDLMTTSSDEDIPALDDIGY